MKYIIQITALMLWVIVSACTSTKTQFITPYSTAERHSQVGYDRPKAAITRTSLGLRYLSQGDYEKAKFNLDKAFVHDPDSENVLRGFAWYYEVVGETELAEQYYLKAMKINDKNPALLNQYGVFLCRHKQLEKSLTLFNASVKILSNMDVSGTYENAATCNLMLGNTEVAGTFFRKALNHNPEQKDSLLGMAKIEFGKGRYHRSRSYLTRFENVAKHNSRSLWLLIRTESKLGNRDAAASYAIKLEQLFPDSQETESYLDTRNLWLK